MRFSTRHDSLTRVVLIEDFKQITFGKPADIGDFRAICGTNIYVYRICVGKYSSY